MSLNRHEFCEGDGLISFASNAAFVSQYVYFKFPVLPFSRYVVSAEQLMG